LVIRGWVSALVAAVFVALFFIIPWLIERYDFLKLKRYFSHEEEKTTEQPPQGSVGRRA
jgi:hypothetical protein